MFHVQNYHPYRLITSLRSYSSTSKCKPIKVLKDGNLETFRTEAFAPSQPALLPKAYFQDLPAIRKWFLPSQDTHQGRLLNHGYLEQFDDATVPLEFSLSHAVESPLEEQFQRAEAPLRCFLDWCKMVSAETTQRLYLAQASFTNLPPPMIKDLPTPDIVVEAGIGDIYDTNIWMGIPPTYTPLHRDPNPNLFIQLAGHKIVRMLPPEFGDRIFVRVQTALGRSGSKTFRGEDMMKGQEKRLLHTEVWGDGLDETNEKDVSFETCIGGGDGLFIPQGWWHSIKGVGRGMTGSVNWWFR